MVPVNIARDGSGHHIGHPLRRAVGIDAADGGCRWRTRASAASASCTTRCGTAASSGLGCGSSPARPATASVTRSISSRQPCQVCRFAYWSWPSTRNHCASGARDCSSRTRVDRVARAGAIELAALEHETRLAVDRELHHRRAMLRAAPAVAPSAMAGRPAPSAARRAAGDRARRARARRARCAPDRSCRRRCRCAARVVRASSSSRLVVARASRAGAGSRCQAALPASPVRDASRSATSRPAASTSGSIRCARPTAGRTACRGRRPD